MQIIFKIGRDPVIRVIEGPVRLSEVLTALDGLPMSQSNNKFLSSYTIKVNVNRVTQLLYFVGIT